MVDFMGHGNDIILSVNRFDTSGSIISVTGEKKVRRKGPEIVKGYIEILDKMTDLYPDECFPDTLKGTGWEIVHLKGHQNFFLDSSKYFFKGLSIDESIKEMERYVYRKAKYGDSIVIRSESSDSSGSYPIFSSKRLKVFEADNNRNEQSSCKIEFELPDIGSPFNKGKKIIEANSISEALDSSSDGEIEEYLSLFEYFRKFGLRTTLNDLKEYVSKECTIGVIYRL